MTAKKKEIRSVRVSGRITPSLGKKAEKALKLLPRWSMSDMIEEGLLYVVSNLPHVAEKK